MLITHLILIGILVFLGFLFRAGKGAFLIAGYNTMSPAERAQYDEKKLCKAMGNFMLVLALLWVPIMIGAILDNMILHMAALLLFILVAFAGALFGVDKAAKK